MHDSNIENMWDDIVRAVSAWRFTLTCIRVRPPKLVMIHTIAAMMLSGGFLLFFTSLPAMI
jgi:hypothetical protein